MTAHLTFVHALSPLHAGTGQGAGIIDLPTAREKATRLPYLPGSSLKGTLRAQCDSKDQKKCRQVFGPDTEGMQTENVHASSVQFSDQRLLLLPVRSLAGTFAWVTSPYVLRRLLRDSADVQAPLPAAPIPDIRTTETCAIAETIATYMSKIKVDTPKVYLEDLALDAQTRSEVNTWALWIGKRIFPNDESWQRMLVERMCIVHDDVFSFLLDTATEITARIRLQADAKTVVDGGLWYEEALPTETILSGMVLVAPPLAAAIKSVEVFELLGELTKKTLQFGGKATVGRGLCRVLLVEEKGA
jgi:CRISPR-associated protein Cmr4